jgi:hypothetical protein
MTKFLLVAGAAVALTGQVGAAEPLLSPRAKAAQPITVSSGSAADPDLIQGQNLVGAAAAAKAAGPAVVAGSAINDPDLVHGQWARAGSPKGLQQLRASGREFQVAPLK